MELKIKNEDIVQLRQNDLNRGRNKSNAPVYPRTVPEAVLGLDKYISKTGTGVVPFDSMPEEVVPGTIYYSTVEDKYYMSDANGTLKPIGASSKSAYDIAVDNGFEGTEVEWLASLKGEKGDTGATGPQGLQGNSGYTGAVGELEVVEDYTEGGVGKAASAEAVKEMAIKSIPESGSFADAYEKARANNVVFPWFLRDVDENGNPIEKMIWHNGYRKFVDAIGAEVVGQKNGLTIKVSADCELRLGYDSSNNPIYPNTTSEKIVQLSKGVNNFTFNELNWNGTDIVKYFEVREIRQNESDTPVSHPDYVEEIDFGWMKIHPNYTSFRSWHQLKKVKRLEVKYTSWNAGLLSDCPELTDVQVRGIAPAADQYNIMCNSKKVEKADFSGLIMNFRESTTSGLYNSFGCDYAHKPGALKYLDIRGIDTGNSARIDGFAQNAIALKTLIIGNFTNGSITNVSKQAGALSDVTNCVLICTTSTPPVLKNCTFTDGNPNDEHSADWDWLAYVDSGVTKCRFSAIYVPSAAAETAYKSNTYVTGGTVGETGWSRWADLIHDIAGTEYEDLI